MESVVSDCKRVAKLAEGGELVAALELCNSLIEKAPKDLVCWRARADVYMQMREFKKAHADLEQLVVLGTKEPSDYFELGLVEYRQGLYRDAVRSFTAGIECGNKANFSYYDKASHFHRAAANFQLKNYVAVIEDCRYVGADYHSHVVGMGPMTAEELMRRASELSGS